jgi:hypothetical protein
MNNKPHKHCKEMAQYAQDAAETDKPWERWEYYSNRGRGWVSLDISPVWCELVEYRRKPRTININGFDVPEPVREPLKHGQEYYIPIIADFFSNPNPYAQFIWTGTPIDNSWLARGLIHLPKEAAAIHTKALLSFTSNE